MIISSHKTIASISNILSTNPADGLDEHGDHESILMEEVLVVIILVEVSQVDDDDLVVDDLVESGSS